MRPRELEISYLFIVEAWGCGYATESVSAIIDMLRGKFNGNEVFAKTQAANLPSRRLLERLKFFADQEVVEFGELQTIYRRRL